MRLRLLVVDGAKMLVIDEADAEIAELLGQAFQDAGTAFDRDWRCIVTSATVDLPQLDNAQDPTPSGAGS